MLRMDLLGIRCFALLSMTDAGTPLLSVMLSGAKRSRSISYLGGFHTVSTAHALGGHGSKQAPVGRDPVGRQRNASYDWYSKSSHGVSSRLYPS